MWAETVSKIDYDFIIEFSSLTKLLLLEMHFTYSLVSTVKKAI